MDQCLDYHKQGQIQDFKLGGAQLKKLRRAEGGAKFVGYFVWKFTILRQKIIFFPILGGSAKFLGYFMWKKHIFSNFRGGREPGVPPPPESAPDKLKVFNQRPLLVRCFSWNAQEAWHSPATLKFITLESGIISHSPVHIICFIVPWRKWICTWNSFVYLI